LLLSGDFLYSSGDTHGFTGDILEFTGDSRTFTGDIPEFTGDSLTSSAISTRLSAILSFLPSKPDTF